MSINLIKIYWKQFLYLKKNKIIFEENNIYKNMIISYFEYKNIVGKNLQAINISSSNST